MEIYFFHFLLIAFFDNMVNVEVGLHEFSCRINIILLAFSVVGEGVGEGENLKHKM